jgi:hypothetical protein
MQKKRAELRAYEEPVKSQEMDQMDQVIVEQFYQNQKKANRELEHRYRDTDRGTATATTDAAGIRPTRS